LHLEVTLVEMRMLIRIVMLYGELPGGSPHRFVEPHMAS